MPQVTAQDVAHASGVSQITVSRVFTGKAPVADATRQRVLDVAERLGYRPNLFASGLRGGATQTIGLIVNSLDVPMTSRDIRHLIHAAQQRGYVTYPINVDHDGDDSAALVRMARNLLDRRMDGIVIYRNMPVSVDARRFLETCGVPVVFMGDWGPPRSPRRIVLDVEPGMQQLADHLAALGHRRVAYFPSTGQADFPEHKLRPTQRAFAKVGVELVIDPRWWIDGHNDRTAQGGYDATHAFLADGPRDVTALMVINDIGAWGAMAALREAGLAVPDDLSVVGFDDIDGARFFDPPLTTIRGPSSQTVGVATFEMLQNLIADPSAEVQRRVFPFELIVRESTGPARSGRHLIRRSLMACRPDPSSDPSVERSLP